MAAQTSYLDLEVEVTFDEGRGYRVEVTSPSGGECAATVPFPLEERALERRLQGLRLALLSSAANVRRLAMPDEKLVQELGAELFDWLFAGDARVLFDSSRQQAAREGNDQWLRLVLRIRPPELAALPWEFLYDTRRDDYLSLSNPLVRYPEVLEPIRPLAVSPPLRILGMVARPSDRSELDVELEKQWLHQAVTDLTDDGRVEVTWVPGQTWRELRRAINQQQWHVFHLTVRPQHSLLPRALRALANEAGGRRGRVSPSSTACDHRCPAQPASSSSAVPSACRSTGIWRSLTDKYGRSQEDLTWAIGVASGREDGTGRAFQARDRWGHIGATSRPRTIRSQRTTPVITGPGSPLLTGQTCQGTADRLDRPALSHGNVNTSPGLRSH